MGIFKEEKCVHCGKKAGRVLRQKLKTGEYICGDCWHGMTVSMLSSLRNCDYEGFLRLLDYVDYSNNELSKMFKENHSYQGIHIDTENRLFWLEGDNPRIYYKFEEITEFDMQFVADEAKDGLLGAKVTGKIYLNLRLGFPEICKEEVLAKNVKAKAKVKEGLFKSKIIYDNPKGMDDFLIYFTNAWKAATDEKIIRIFNAEREEAREEARREVQQEAKALSEVQAAMALFMFDDLGTVTLEKLDKQRKRLLKTFHPDEGSGDDTAFAQKINVAYDLLKCEIA